MVWFGKVWFGSVWLGVVGMVWVVGVGEIIGVVKMAAVVVVMKPVFFNIHGFAEIGCLGPLVLFRLIYK